MSLFGKLFKSTDLTEYDLKVISQLKESLKGYDYQMEFNKLFIVIKVKRE